MGHHQLARRFAAENSAAKKKNLSQVRALVCQANKTQLPKTKTQLPKTKLSCQKKKLSLTSSLSRPAIVTFPQILKSTLVVTNVCRGRRGVS